ncbi:pyridoxal phosphate-dependent aminotransferase [Vulcanisaeta thermophila]|uniref:pyridoxal phosphate-dependent aminotransferase n=1 Tax=Vulcanisaeta thermophila TaxID=867917 RepID=UPI000853B25F|nr:aminotransferase class I/II-fold pyridoxal phosphate-dependent enzyme [Vulcanisaeta thermophila]
MIRARGHGGYGWREGLLDFSTNINPLGTPGDLVLLIKEAVDKGAYSHHPTELGDELRSAVARYEGVDEDLVYVFNGATEALQLIIMHLRPRALCTLIPNYTDYLRIARLLGIPTKLIEYWGSSSLRPGIARDCGEGSVLVLSNPNTPLGYLIGAGELMELINEAEGAGVNVIIDESFMDFTSPGSSLIGRVWEFRNLVVVKSYTKFLAIPGLRVGAAFTRMGIEDLVPTWPVNSIAEYAVSRYLPRAHEFREETVNFVLREGRRLLESLMNLGLEVIKSKTHYLTFRGAPGLWAELRKHGILIRDLSNVPPLGPGYFRVSLRSPSQNDLLIKALSDALGSKIK